MSNKSINLPLLTWKEPVKTGKVFGGLVAALIFLKSVNVLSLFFRLASLVLAVSATAEYGGKLILGQGLVTKFRPAKLSTSFSSRATGCLETFTKELPALESEGQELLYSVNIENTLKSAGLFYILYKITSWVSLYSLVFTSVVLAFTLPFVYEKYQDEINAGLKQATDIANEKYQETSKIVSEKAAPYLKQADEKLGPVSDFIKSKYQVRTASTTVAEDEKATAFTSSSEASATKSTLESKTSAFPDAPTTEPLKAAVEEIKESVNVDDLKNDLLKNKEAATNF